MRNLILLFCLILVFSSELNGQKVSGDFFFRPKDVHAVFSLRVLPNNTFEYIVYRGAGNSFAYGAIVSQGNKHILCSDTGQVDLRIFSEYNNEIVTGQVLVDPIYYKDSSIENESFLILNEDYQNKRPISQFGGIQIDSGFNSFRIQLKIGILSRAVSNKEIKGNKVKVYINVPGKLDTVSFLIDGSYFKILNENEVRMFTKQGEFICTMRKI